MPSKTHSYEDRFLISQFIMCTTRKKILATQHNYYIIKFKRVVFNLSLVDGAGSKFLQVTLLMTKMLTFMVP